MEVTQATLSALRRELHRYPELALEEHHTAQVIERELDKAGVLCGAVRAQILQCGLLIGLQQAARRAVGDRGWGAAPDGAGAGQRSGLATLTGGKGPGPIVALRADIDALPMQERHETDYCSQVDGKMHACGHDAHTAMLLSALQVLSAHRDEWSGQIVAVFEQGEETSYGVLPLLEYLEDRFDGMEAAARSRPGSAPPARTAPDGREGSPGPRQSVPPGPGTPL